MKIRQHLRLHPTTPSVKLGQILDIPSCFIYQLYRQNRFSGSQPTTVRRSQAVANAISEKKPCALCSRGLKATEDVYCQPCNQTIQNRLHIRYSKT